MTPLRRQRISLANSSDHRELLERRAFVRNNLRTLKRHHRRSAAPFGTLLRMDEVVCSVCGRVAELDERGVAMIHRTSGSSIHPVCGDQE